MRWIEKRQNESVIMYHCPLGKLEPVKPDVDEIKRHGWIDDGILVVSINDERLTWVERETLRQIGDRLYGKRNLD